MEEKSRQVQCKRCCILVCKRSVKLTSVIILPLMLAIFTIIITFQQREDAQRQRHQDLNISLIAREQDRDIARQQRENDMRIAVIQQNISRELDAIRYEQERQKYFDELLVAYMNDIGALLEKNNGSLTSSPAMSALATAKTLQILPHIGPIRAAQLIRFLYRAGQLSTLAGEQPLDLTGAQLVNLDLTDVSFRHISLVGVHLYNVSFAGQNIFEADFTSARFISVNFTRTNCTRMKFNGAIMDDVDFSSAVIISANFSKTLLNRVNFKQVTCINTTFDEAVMNKVVFSHATMKNNFFYGGSLIQAIFDYAKCFSINFIGTKFVNANLSQTLLDGVLFHNVNLVDAVLHLNQKGFLHRLDFLGSNLSRSSFNGAYLPYTRFTRCDLFAVDFRQSDVSNSAFRYSNMEEADFTNADMRYVLLKSSSLAFATLFGARLTEATFSLSDLSYTNLSKTSCSDNPDEINNCSVKCKWEENEYSVLWKHNSVQCNGDIYREASFFRDNHILCNESLNSSWNYVSDPPVILQLHPNDSNLCVLAPSPKHFYSYLRTFVNLSRFENFIRTGAAAVAVRTQISGQVEFSIDENTLDLSLTSSGLLQGKTGAISSSTEIVELYVTFYYDANSPTWLSYLEVAVIPRVPPL